LYIRNSRNDGNVTNNYRQGLLNVKAQILKSLKPNIAVRYDLYTLNEMKVSRSSWVELLRKEQSERVVLWMRENTPQVNEPDQADGKLPVHADKHQKNETFRGKQKGADVENRAQQRVAENKSLSGNFGLIFANEGLKVAPFLEWPMIDRFGRTDSRSRQERVGQHLSDILSGLKSQFALSPGIAGRESIKTDPRYRSRSTPWNELIQEKALSELQDTLEEREAKSFLEMTQNLLHLFVAPECAQGTHQMIKLFWGAVLTLTTVG
jgi:hypothetical protein